MTEAKGLTFDDKFKHLAPMLFMLWVQFNVDNEPANCIHLVDVRRLDISVEAWPGLRTPNNVT